MQLLGDSNLLDTGKFGKYHRKLFQGFTFLAEVHIRDQITFKATLKEVLTIVTSGLMTGNQIQSLITVAEL